MSAALKLYDTVDELETVREFLLESEGGELTPEMEALLDHAVAGFEAKVERVALMVRELTATAEAIETEAKRVAARAKAATRAAESLKGYLKHQLERADVTSVKGVLATVRVQANPPKVVGTAHADELYQLRELFQSPLVRYIPPAPARYELDAKAVVAAWKAGEDLPAGISIEVGSHLRIA